MSISKQGGLFVSFGEEEFFLDRELQKLKTRVGVNVIVVDGYEVSDAEVLDVLEQRSFDERPRLVILDNAQKVKGDKALKAYFQEWKGICEFHAICRSDKLTAFWSEVGKKGSAQEYKKLKTWDNRNEVVNWMRGEAKTLGVTLDELNAKDIFQVVGGNLYRLANELRKLAIYVGKGGTISRDKWTQVLTVSSIAEPWEIAEWAADKRPQKALNGLAALYKNGSDDPAVPLAYALMKQVERLLVARTLLDKGATDEDVAVRFGMNPWRCKNSLVPMAKKHSPEKLADLMCRLCTLDIQMKTSGPSKRTQLELVILTFAS